MILRGVTVDLVGNGYGIPIMYVIFGIWLIHAMVFGIIVRALAETKRRNTYNYFWLGFFAGLIGLIYTVGVPALNAEEAHAVQVARAQNSTRTAKINISITAGAVVAITLYVLEIAL